MVKRHPIFQKVWPKLTQSEFEYLKRGMEAERRCYDDLVIWHDFLVDGHHRLEIADQLGWKEGQHYNYRVLDPDLSEEQVKDWIVVAHVGRRNAPPDVRDKLIYSLYKSRKKTRASSISKTSSEVHLGKQGKTVNVIADDLGVGKSTVDRAIKKGKEFHALVSKLPPRIQQQHIDDVCPLNATQVNKLLQHDQLQEVERAVRVGQAKTTAEAFKKVTGKSLPAGKGSMSKIQKREEDRESLVDGRNIPVPKELVTVFESLKPLRAHIRVLESELKAIEEMSRERGGEYLCDQWTTLKVDLKNVIIAMKESLPWAVCPFCKGKGCKKQPAKTLIWCLGRGYLTKKQKGLTDETWSRLET